MMGMISAGRGESDAMDKYMNHREVEFATCHSRAMVHLHDCFWECKWW